MKKLHMMVGLPRSGKSTEAKKLGFPVVCPDDIRVVLHGGVWRANMEPMVWAIAHIMVETLFMTNDNIILDACHVSKPRRLEWESLDWGCVYHVCNTPSGVCIVRALSIGRQDLVPVIRRMAASWDPPGMGQDC